MPIIRPLFSLLLVLLSLCGAAPLSLWAQSARWQHALSVPSKFDEQVGLRGGVLRLRLEATNKGAQPVTKVGYRVVYRGVESEEFSHTLEVPLEKTDDKGTLLLDIALPQEVGADQIGVKVTTVNGHPNEARPSDYTTRSMLSVLPHSAKRRVVIEDFTGSWCGYCPLGIGALETLHKRFGGDVIGLAVHGGDPMAIRDCQPLLDRYVTAYPTLLLNREKEVNATLPVNPESQPAYSLYQDVVQALQAPTEAEVSISKALLNPEGDRVSIEATARFLIDRDNSPYRLVYLLVADSLSGTSAEWSQKNYFWGNDQVIDFLPQFVQAPGTLRGFVYNDVVVRAPNVLGGQNNSLPSSIKAHETYTHSYDFNISDVRSQRNSSELLIQHKDKLRAVVLLVNRKNQSIVNAAQLPVEQAPPITSLDIEMGDQNLITLSTPEVLTLPEGVEAYAVVPDGDKRLKLQLVATAGQNLPSGEGFVLKAESGSTLQLHFAPAQSPTIELPSNHLLQATFANGRTRLAQHKLYVFRPEGTQGMGFYWQEGSKGDWVERIAGQAYLALPTAQAAPEVYLLEGQTLTTLPQLHLDTTQPTAPCFDLWGRPLQQPQAGALYLQGGKKVLR